MMAASANTLEYSGKTILAPMVRISTLPFRLLCLRYGADIVYSQEIIDFKMLQCSRIENKVLGTIDFTQPDGRCVFRTCAEERNRVVFQMGTANAAQALKVAKLVENDVAGIDINMGCPKPFSINGGMGAALLTKPEKIKEILTTLVQGLSIPVTCKIRLLPTVEETIELVKLIESCGVAALALHGRYKNQRSSSRCHADIMKQVVASTSLPIIANGGSKGIHAYEDIEKFRIATGAASVMVARAVMFNPSLFRKEGTLPWETVTLEFFKLGMSLQPVFANVKYIICAGLAVTILQTPVGQALLASRTFEEMAVAMGWQDAYHEVERAVSLTEVAESCSRFGMPCVVGEPCPKYARLSAQPEESEDGTCEMHVTFKLVQYRDKPTPKTALLEWARRNGKRQPTFETVERSLDRTYKSVCSFDGKTYSSSFWEKKKQSAEHAASLVCMEVLGIRDPRWS